MGSFSISSNVSSPWSILKISFNSSIATRSSPTNVSLFSHRWKTRKVRDHTRQSMVVHSPMHRSHETDQSRCPYLVNPLVNTVFLTLLALSHWPLIFLGSISNEPASNCSPITSLRSILRSIMSNRRSVARRTVSIRSPWAWPNGIIKTVPMISRQCPIPLHVNKRTSFFIWKASRSMPLIPCRTITSFPIRIWRTSFVTWVVWCSSRSTRIRCFQIEQNAYVGVYGAAHLQKKSLFEDLMKYLERPAAFSTSSKFQVVRFEFESVTQSRRLHWWIRRTRFVPYASVLDWTTIIDEAFTLSRQYTTTVREQMYFISCWTVNRSRTRVSNCATVERIVQVRIHRMLVIMASSSRVLR